MGLAWQASPTGFNAALARMLQQPVDAQTVPWPEIEAATSGDGRCDARWIFHIGHVGSTLISRMLGELPDVLAIREPRLLRDLALSPPATSFVSEIAPELVPPGERALFMFATPRNYVASILAGENSVQESRMLGESRAQRMAARVGTLAVRNDAELAAAAWACEMTALEAASDAMPERQIAWADFDRMLEDMPAELARIASFFNFSAEESALCAIAQGPLMMRYSKAPEYAYSPALRSELIAEVCTTRGSEIDDALALLGRAAERSPLLARALERAGEA